MTRVAIPADLLRPEAPRILLVSGTPPGETAVGETALASLISGYPAGHVTCLALVPRGYPHEPLRDGALSTVRVRLRPAEAAWKRFPGRLGSAVARLQFMTRFRRAVATIVEEAVSLARAERADKVCMVLDSVTTLAVGPAVAEKVGLPLLSLVWDAPEHLLRQTLQDRFTRNELMARFGETLRRSERVAVVSAAMAAEYGGRYGARPIVVRHPVPQVTSAEPSREALPPHDGAFVIAVAGSIYAESAWRAFLEALHLLDWAVSGRPIRLRVLGSSIRVRSWHPTRIEYLGFQPPGARDAALAAADALYLPEPFETELREVARLSFPAKLSAYIGARRPVLLHAPENAAVAAFAREHPLGATCASLEPIALATALRGLAEDRSVAQRAAEEMARLAEGEFSAAACRRRFAELVGSGPVPP